ncbi:unnamed protein product [Nippostrongylus brasiliensis]|uniref:Uncharacterized protein n=1 Tax=Nippostrongylus brasiliensis TaxID=27835 RepID=A0A0N4YZB3_NIPBR|nr:unnamed protein product [Nippostrongylus brasiliensis]
MEQVDFGKFGSVFKSSKVLLKAMIYIFQLKVVMPTRSIPARLIHQFVSSIAISALSQATMTAAMILPAPRTSPCARRRVTTVIVVILSSKTYEFVTVDPVSAL